MEIRSVAVPSRFPGARAAGLRTIRNRKNEPGLDHERRHLGGQLGCGLQWHVGSRPFSFHGDRGVRNSVDGPG